MSLPPIINSPLFNSSYFNSSNGYLTLTTGDQRYLRLGGICPVLVIFLELLLVLPAQANRLFLIQAATLA
ncbi:hypothetical protein PPTG_24596 [Phytophthora nicotianae INRA-310]|uniref:Uncharacterized protein n=1 Tax=Phytophthora nicotianae (strain INRA-310) TaxID=761204 RepID=W2PBW3_PHYN3|nr:hypothetical protein PPTG_24596 [Phytophthora nicotianae INRA-310]ETM98542.1 hypothetical protein PPTG_24596 [Phytophthora nicotianae INRA-310]